MAERLSRLTDKELTEILERHVVPDTVHALIADLRAERAETARLREALTVIAAGPPAMQAFARDHDIAASGGLPRSFHIARFALTEVIGE